MTDNPWQRWQDQIDGKRVPNAVLNTPCAGFYRWVRKSSYGGKRWAVPVAYWPLANGVLGCRIDGKDVSPERAIEAWNSVCEDPVPHKWYQDVAESDTPVSVWPDGMDVSPPAGDNAPPEDNSFEGLQTAIENLAREATTRLAGPPVTDQLEADNVSNLADRLAELWAKAEEARKVEKRPHDAEAERIQKKWRPLLHAAEVFKALKYKLLTPWELKEKARLKQEAEAAAVAGAPAEEPRRPRAGTRGRAMTLRSFKRAEITDWKLVMEFFFENPEVRATVQDCANRIVRTGMTVPGTQVVEEERVV